MPQTSLVSIIIPAYKAAYFEDALRSALDQDYEMIELVIGDDCQTDAIFEIIDRYRPTCAYPIRYLRNSPSLGEIGNVVRCISEASGTYIKFLYDDDLLAPDCVRLLVETLETVPGIALVSSRRRLIGEAGENLPDTVASAFPFTCDVVLDGRELAAFLGEHVVNFIGEPSSVMCRRDDLLEFGGELFSLDGQQVQWVGDLAIYAKLLQLGNLALLSRPLSSFRVSPAQYSQGGRDNPAVARQWHQTFRELMRRLGWAGEDRNHSCVKVSPLLAPEEFESVNVLQLLVQAGAWRSPAEKLADWLSVRMPTEGDMLQMNSTFEARGGGTEFGIFVLDRLGDLDAVIATLKSLDADRNLYAKTRIVVLTPHLIPAENHSEALRFVMLKQGDSIELLNREIVHLACPWFCLVDAGDEFTAAGLHALAYELLEAPACRAVYGDELYRKPDSALETAMRPSFNLDFLLSRPDIMGRHWFFNIGAFVALDGFDPQSGGAFELDLILRMVEAGGMGDLAHVDEPIMVTTPALGAFVAHEQQAISRHLAERGYLDAQVAIQATGGYRIDYRHGQAPLVSIVVAAGRLPHGVQVTLESLLQSTAYEHFEVLVVTAEDCLPSTEQWLQRVEEVAGGKVRCLRYTGTFLLSGMCNLAARNAHGKYLVFFDEGMLCEQPDWLGELLNQALRPEVAVVGAKVLYASGPVKHAGIVLGLRGPAGGGFVGESGEAPGYLGRLQSVQNYSAVSLACMMVPRELFLEEGGLDERHFLADHSDVDLCLRLGQAGYLVTWTPFAVVRQCVARDEQAFDAYQRARDRYDLYERWLPRLASDPAYNQNLALSGFGFTPAYHKGREWSRRGPSQLPRVLCHPSDANGCGHYRLRQPFHGMQKGMLIEGAIISDVVLSPVELERFEPTSIIFQRQYTPRSLGEIGEGREGFSKAFRVLDLDDYIPGVPPKSIHYEQVPKNMFALIKKALTMVDRFVVSTESLANVFDGLHSDIRVMHNRLPPEWWGGLQGQRRVGRKPRVGWAGGTSHRGDLELLHDVVRALADEVEWVFFGMCPDLLRPHVHEFHKGIPIEQYPERLASMNLDLALAPLEMNLFNECKSNLRLLEYGACGFPVICTDIVTYRCGMPVTLVKNRTEDWIDAIRMHLSDLDATAKMGDALRDVVKKDWMLQGDALLEWRKVWLPD